MGKVSVAEIKELMTATGVGMMDCKKALVEADGDMEKAVTLLREKGLATQAKKSGRVAAEGICTAVVKGNVGCVLEVNIETDFAANNDEFKAFVAAVADTVIETNPADVDALKATKISGGDKTVEETLQDLFIKIRENMVIRRFKRMEGILVPYVHGAGSIGVMVKLDSDIAADNAELLAAGKDCALQVATERLFLLTLLTRRERSCWLRWLRILRWLTSLSRLSTRSSTVRSANTILRTASLSRHSLRMIRYLLASTLNL